MSSIYFSSNHRSTNSREKARLTNGLPSYSAAVQEKLYRHGRSSSWLIPLSTPIPGMRDRRLRLWVPNPARIHQVSVARFGRKRGTLVLCFGAFLLVFITFAVHKRFNSSTRQWPTFPTGDPPTLVFTRADLQKIWRWEIDSGHYPSSQKSASRSFMPLVLKSKPVSNLWFSCFSIWGHSSRSDRFLVSNLKSCSATAESHSPATKAAADFKICHEHAWRWTQTSVS